MSRPGIAQLYQVLCFKFWCKFGDFIEIILEITPGSPRQQVLYKFNVIANQILYQRKHHLSKPMTLFYEVFFLHVCSSCRICLSLPIKIVGFLFVCLRFYLEIMEQTHCLLQQWLESERCALVCCQVGRYSLVHVNKCSEACWLLGSFQIPV